MDDDGGGGGKAEPATHCRLRAVSRCAARCRRRHSGEGQGGGSGGAGGGRRGASGDKGMRRARARGAVKTCDPLPSTAQT